MRVIVNGASGRMGFEVTKLVKEGYQNSELYALVDSALNNSDTELTYSDLAFCVKGADVIIDFSHHSVTPKLCKYAEKTSTPVVIATTGQTPDEAQLIADLAKKVPVFLSGNMSIGIALLSELAKKAAAVMKNSDVEIVEIHHNKKVDAPSGTAFMLANAVKEVRTGANIVLGRAGDGVREENDIGISAVRVGGTVGIHEVIIGNDIQTITLKHEAHSRKMLAEGSIDAARFLMGKPAGIYNMKDMLKDEKD